VARYVNDQWIPVAGLPSEAITSLLPIDGGWLIGTYGSGLIRLREGVVTQLRQRDGLPHDIVYGLVHDSKKRVFGTGVRGVFELDWKEKDPLIRAYDHTDGLADDECNGGAVYCDRGGRLWFGTIGGASELSPAALETQGGNASALIIDVRVDRAPVNVANGVCITGREVIFEYGVVDFISPSKIVFQCRLEGYEREWLPLTSARTLRYTNLAPGKYTFMVRARGQSGVFGPTAMLECTS